MVVSPYKEVYTNTRKLNMKGYGLTVINVMQVSPFIRNLNMNE